MPTTDLAAEAAAFAAETAWVETWDGTRDTIPGIDDLRRELAGDTVDFPDGTSIRY